MPDSTEGGLGRNDPCHCGSAKKYKRCCLGKDEAAEREARAEAAQAATPPPEKESAPAAPARRGSTDQTWKRGAHNYRPFERFMTPRKRGDG